MTDDSDDEGLAIRMMDGDKDALREVLRRHLEPVKEVLEGKYGTTVQQADLDEAVNRAILKLWRNAGSYDTNSSLGAWLYTMAESAVIDIYRREKRHRRKYPLLPDEFEVAQQCDPEPEEPLTQEDNQELKDLDHIVEHKLPPLQKAIIKADLVLGGTADAGSLAELHATSKNSIYVSRNKAHETIRKEMTQLAQQRERLRGKK